MKKIWFKRKSYGWGWTLGTWESFVVMAFYIAANVYIFMVIDSGSHSGSDTLINFAPRFLMLTAILYFICWWKGEKPRWQWACLPCLPTRCTQAGTAGRRQGKQVENVNGVLLNGGVAVIPTDTTYGMVGLALNERTVNEIYRLRKRDLDKPLIVLIADKKDLKKFGVAPTPAQEKILEKVWPASASLHSYGHIPPKFQNVTQDLSEARASAGKPGPTSVILSCQSDKFSYLHRGKNTLAFRLPAKEELRELIRKVGPLVAPSANPQGHSVAKTIAEAKAYFGHYVDFYQDGGIINVSSSKLIDITDGTEKVLR